MSTSVILDNCEFLVQALIEARSDALAVCDEKGRIVLANRALEQLFGFACDAVLGEPLTKISGLLKSPDGSLLPVESRPESHVLATGQPFKGAEFLFERPGGESGTLLATASPLCDRTGRLIGTVSTFTDITERKHTLGALVASEIRFRELAEQSLDLIAYEDLDGNFQYASPASRLILGYEPAEMVGKNSVDFVHPDEQAVIRERHARPERDAFTALFRARHKDGSYRWLDTNCRTVRDAASQPVGFMIISRDVTERQASAQAIERSEAALALAQEVAHVGSFELDLTANVATWTKELYRICGLSPEEFTVLPDSLWQFNHPDDAGAVRLAVDEARMRNVPYETEHRIVRHDGTVRWVFERGLFTHDAAGAPFKLVGTVLDVTDRKVAEEHAAYLAQHDALTRLPNRLLFSEYLERSIVVARRHNRRAAVVCVDLDRFKMINDSLGHTFGDRILLIVADRLQGCVREGDVLSRPGGDAFLIALADLAGVDDLPLIAQKMLRAIAQPCDIEGREFVVTASIGISVFPDDETDADQLVMQAEAAMYRAKEAGRDTFALALPHLQTAAKERLGIEHDLRNALKRNELRLHYQPIVDLETGRVVGCESLVRWQHPSAGLLYPAAFLDLAEETGLIVPIGDWVLKTACAQASTWSQISEQPLFMAVNISARQMQHHSLLKSLRSALASWDWGGHHLDFEIVESTVMGDAELALKLLTEIKSTGVSVSIDDFGTGYSSLAYLRAFPLDTLKIDRAFIKDIEEQEKNAALVEWMITLAHSMNLYVVAEGVETAGQLEKLQILGCDRMQGFYFSEALSAEAFEVMLKNRKALAL